MQAAQQVAVTVDPARTVQAFGKAFSGRDTFIRELLQNARRAGASRVDISWDPEAKRLVVEDDGAGIEDFSTLLGVARSGWSEETIEREAPYGLGFLASLFNCQRVRVESRGTCLEADTTHLLAMKPVPLGTCDRAVGTRVEMHGTALPARRFSCEKETLKSTCIGFPIDVVFNGEALQRPDAYRASEPGWTESDIGQMRLSLSSTAIHAYLQGFRIWGNGLCGTPTLVHLDPRQFLGRLPDRDCLIDRDAQCQRIEAAVKAAAYEKLAQAKACMPADQFVRDMWKTCLLWGAPELLNDLPCVPATTILRHDGDPRRTRWWGDDQWHPVSTEGVLSQQELSSMRLACGELEPAEAAYLHAVNGRLVDEIGKLDRGHWLHGMAVSMTPPVVDDDDEGESDGPENPGDPVAWGALTITPVGFRGTTASEVDGVDVEIRVCDEIRVNGPFGEVSLPEGLGIGIGESYEEEGCVIYATPKTCSTVVRQVSNHHDNDRNSVDEDAEAHSIGEFERAMASFCGAGPAAVLQMLLQDKIDAWNMPAECRSKAYRLEVDESGNLSLQVL